MNIHRSSCPVVDTTTETFVEHITVGGERQRIAFTRQVVWLQESESTVLMMHGGRKLDVSAATHNDFCGYLTSMGISSPSPEDIAKHYGVGAGSSLEIVVKTTVILRPVMETSETQAYNASKPDIYKSNYLDVPYGWRQEVAADGEKTWPRLERRVVGEGITWSSKLAPEENEVTRTAFRKRWTAHGAVQRPGVRTPPTD